MQKLFVADIDFVIITGLEILNVLGLLRSNYKNNIWNSETRVKITDKLPNELWEVPPPKISLAVFSWN